MNNNKWLIGVIALSIIGGSIALCWVGKLQGEAVVAMFSGFVGWIIGAKGKNNGANTLVIAGGMALLVGLSGCSWWQTQAAPRVLSATAKAGQCMTQCVTNLTRDCNVDRLQQCAILCAINSGIELICPANPPTTGMHI
jgi:hypothetical protein